MYTCSSDKKVNEDVLSAFAILKNQPTLVLVDEVVRETGIDDEKMSEVQKHIEKCEKCAQILEQLEQMRIVLEATKGSVLSVTA
ncbi:hypothetical protein HY486_04195 [Candidatus Woesearchaeota archaeon]|nr:hypothetical protein [Candidatus Woesearchaeota archaeon]